MYRLRRQLASAMVWMTIPFILASGMPRVGCVCANGDHRPFCRGYLGGGKPFSKACSICSGCECCRADTDKSSGGASSHSCCPNSKASTSSGVAQSSRCCQPYLIQPSVLKDNLATQAPPVDNELVWQPELDTLALIVTDLNVATSSLPPPASSGVDILHFCCVLVI